MKWTKRDEQRKARVIEIALSLPEAEAPTRPGHPHTGFVVRKKKFGWHLVDHHGDGRISLQVRATPGENMALIERHPDRYYRPQYMAVHGWVGLYLDLAQVDWDEIESLIVASYLLQAPKTLARLV